MIIEQISIHNLQSHADVLAIEDIFKEISGVQSVTVIIPTQTVFIRHNGVVLREKLLDILRKNGYPELHYWSSSKKINMHIDKIMAKFRWSF